MLKSKKLLIGYKLFFALLGFSAVITEIATLVERQIFNASNFFSFFTVETNILVVVALLVSAIAVAANKADRVSALRGAIAVYILIVGIGFSLLLSGLENVVLTAVPWDNIVLHYIIPAAVLIDIVIDRPQKYLSFKKSLVWLIFPAAYVAYSLVRGGFVGWYPYPFLDPIKSGVATVTGTVIGLLVLAVLLTWFVTRLSRAKSK